MNGNAPVEVVGPFCIAHPLEMSDDDRARFGQTFAEYEVLQPFAQLGRPTFDALSPGCYIGRRASKPAPFMLQARGWSITNVWDDVMVLARELRQAHATLQLTGRGGTRRPKDSARRPKDSASSERQRTSSERQRTSSERRRTSCVSFASPSP
jgi:hypothetical protein